MNIGGKPSLSICVVDLVRLGTVPVEHACVHQRITGNSCKFAAIEVRVKAFCSHGEMLVTSGLVSKTTILHLGCQNLPLV